MPSRTHSQSLSSLCHRTETRICRQATARVNGRRRPRGVRVPRNRCERQRFPSCTSSPLAPLTLSSPFDSESDCPRQSESESEAKRSGGAMCQEEGGNSCGRGRKRFARKRVAPKPFRTKQATHALLRRPDPPEFVDCSSHSPSLSVTHTCPATGRAS